MIFRLPREPAFTIFIDIFYALKRGYRVKNARKVFNLAALFALYPRFYAIKSTYANSEYRF